MKKKILAFIFSSVSLCSFSQHVIMLYKSGDVDRMNKSIDSYIFEDNVIMRVGEVFDPIYIIDMEVAEATSHTIVTPYVNTNFTTFTEVADTVTVNVYFENYDRAIFFVLIVLNDADYIQATASIHEIEKEDIQLNIYPMPAKDLVTVSFNSESNHDIGIYTLNGQLVMEETNAIVGSNQIQLNISDLQSGIYLVRVGNTVAKLVKY